MQFRNREGLQNFDFVLYERRDRRGVSAMLRVKNEEKKLRYCLASILPLFDEIVLVDNGSEDATLEIARRFKEQCDLRGTIRIHLYPFRVARCGPEHRDTPEDSVHSLVYFYNWCLSQCSCRYVCKWDADMVLRQEARDPFARLLRQIQRDEACWELPGQNVYRDLASRYYLAKDYTYQEIRVFPYGFHTRYHKNQFFEKLASQPPLPVKVFETIAYYELKFADEDEFSHWSTTEFPSPRKKQEWQTLQLLRAGTAPGNGFERLPQAFLDDEVQ